MSRPPTVLALAAALLAASLPLLVAPWAGATVASAPAYAHYYGPSDPAGFPDGFPVFILAGEPSIGINWNTGAAFYQHGFDTYRLAFDDHDLTATWTDVTPPTSQFNVDPILFTDAQTGRTYAGGLDGTCSVLAFTDDDGASWTPAGNACVATLDHESIVSGPWRPGPSTSNGARALHDRAVIYCAQASFVTCMTSLDGGLTFSVPSQVRCVDDNPGFHGSLHIGPDGHVYLPFKDCGGRIGVAVSPDSGRNWLSRPVPHSVTPDEGFDPDVATDTAGKLYIGFANGTGGAFAATSLDHGTTWSRPVDVGASLGIVNSTFHEMVAADAGRAAVAFLGTTTQGAAYTDGFTGVWHLYVATTFDGGLTWSTQQVTSDPVQRGWICNDGTACTTGRNLLDFMDAQVDAEGRVLIAYVDGCVGACAGPDGTAAQSDSATAVVTRQFGGKTLRAAYDGAFERLYSLPGGPYAGKATTAIPLAGAAAGGAGGYTFAWSVDAAPAASAAGPASFSAAASPTSSFTPDVAGTYTLRLTVTDGAANVVSATSTLTASAPPTTGSVIHEGSILVGGPHTSVLSAGETGLIEGLDAFFFDAPPAGTRVTTRTIDHAGLGYDLDLHFFAASGAYISSCASAESDEVCTVPAGADVGEVAAFYGALLEVVVVTV